MSWMSLQGKKDGTICQNQDINCKNIFCFWKDKIYGKKIRTSEVSPIKICLN